ncbi:hypothetical protein D915_010158 [Fasciola hepatica]|uniref:Ubiquitin-like domain-containing protein n=1 Tax=Fasciola hepatica TaxID=6192 RepID=A0A4E0QVX0_FASHE|nr:hypothetical protein D915_010158 [Fasciola hepatica]
MRIDVHMPDGKVFALDVDPQGHISQIDEEMEKRIGQLPVSACYYHKNQLLNNSKRIADCHLEDGAKIFLHCLMVNGRPCYNYDEICNHTWAQ